MLKNISTMIYGVKNMQNFLELHKLTELHKSRLEIFIKVLKKESGIGRKVVNLGDRNKGPLTILLRKMGFSVITVDLKDADVIQDLNKKLKFRSNVFDIAIAGEIIEHLYHTTIFLKEVYRILKFGGILILSFPNIACLKNRFKLLFGMLPTYCADAEDFEIKYGVPGHIRDFNLSLVLRLLRNCKFEVKGVWTNGIFLKQKKIVPSILCPKTFGDVIILKAVKMI